MTFDRLFIYLPQRLLTACARRWGAFSLVVLFALLSGCASNAGKSDTLTDFSQIKDDEVLVVGKIARLPAVVAASLKQETDTFTPFANQRVLIWLEATPESESPIGLLGYWDQTFYFAIPRKTQQITSLERAYPSGEEMVYVDLPLPEPMTFLVRSDDRAVYIGTLRFYVDEFDNVSAIEVVDEAQKAQYAFENRFNTSAKLRVSLMAPESYFR